MKDFLCIYEMLLDELANYKISEVAALGQKNMQKKTTNMEAK